MIIPVLSRLKTKSIISLGEHEEKRVTKIGSCTVYSWLPPRERSKFMANAKLVIFSGGHNTCFEVIKHVKPSICVPTQPEQLANAKKMQDLNCSIIARNKAQLLQAIREMEKHIDFYKKNVQKINQYCSRFKGVDTAVKIIEEVAQKFGK
jgi:UDP:flavonoid glycosyltransferase YjiC (YdhE family)